MTGRTPIAFLTAVASLLLLGGTASAATAPAAVTGQVLVRHEGDAQPEIVRTSDVTATVDRLNADAGVAYAEPVYRTRAAAAATVPNLGFGDEWHLRDSTQIARAWNLAGAGSASVLVGTVDSGVNFAHTALAGASLWTNAGEVPGNGIDDDQDGCVDDVHGCDLVDHDGDPTDANGHGTATAGIVSSGWAAGIKYAGVAPGTTLITARALDAYASGTTAQLAAALDYVADHGAKVVNVSVTGPNSLAVNDVIASHPDTLFVAAAGNDAANDDSTSMAYPCATPAANVICVAATDATGALAGFSNYGAGAVDLGAPGVKIATLTLNGYSGGWSGTSFAAPVVAGVAALAFSAAPNATVADVRRSLLNTVDPVASLAGRTVTGGKLNAYAALHALTGRSDAAPVTDAPANPAAGTGAGAATATTATAAPATEVAGATAASPAGTLAVSGTARRQGTRSVAVTLRCKGSAGCAGKLAVAGQKAATDFSLNAGGTATVTLRAKLTTKTKAVTLVATVRGASLNLKVKLAKARR
jgi:hypothetical protein